MSSSPSLHLARLRHLQVLQHRLHLLEQPARGLPVAGAREVFQPVEHAVEIALGEHAGIAVERPRKLLRILLHLLRQRLQELVHGGAQIIHQLLELLVAGAALERLAQRLLRLAQRLLGLADIAVLDAARPCPTAAPPPRATDRRCCACCEVVIDRAQAEIDAGVGRELFGRDGERVERGQHQRLLVGVERQDAALLDQRARQRLDEEALRQREFERLAAAFVAGLVVRDQRHRHLGAGPGVLGEIVDGLPAPAAGARLRQREAHIRAP